MEKDLFKNTTAVAKPLCRLVTVIIEPVVLWIIREVKAIPVYKGSKKIIETLDISVNSLAAGSNIAIFLDNVENNDYTGQKDSGFVHLAMEYYVKYGKVLYFYPVYIDQKRMEISIGVPITYFPENGHKEEEQRVLAILAEALRPK